jgi:type II secretory pathway predicted ATPase ExeA
MDLTAEWALLYDLATEKDFKIPTQPERRERALRDLIKKRQKPIALFIDDAHDLHSKTLIGLKRLTICAGSSMEEIGSRATIFELEGLGSEKRKYLKWLLAQSVAPKTKIESVITEDAVAMLGEKLSTPLRFVWYPKYPSYQNSGRKELKLTSYHPKVLEAR